MACGAEGIISVASNVYVSSIAEMVTLAATDDYAAARELHLKYLRVFNDIFVEPNPVPIKFLMKTLGLIESDEVRLPLCGLQPENTERITKLAGDFPIA